MPIPDFYECLAFDRMEPFGDTRGDLQAGIIASTIANFAGKVSKKDAAPKDFMPFLENKAEDDAMRQAEKLHAHFFAFKTARELRKKQVS